ncbi:helix-turn-helix domain-containing protein [Streptomyces sp. NPDC007088]|uniref:helix-turn-helix domain-containing protein n=1 Tax=Streptomyces sp. NPDC007088 TaxID=3364773 RepID=UPI0036783F11
MTSRTRTPAVPLPPPEERRRLRERHSLSRARLAARLGVSREILRKWENGRTEPRGGERETYAKVLATLAGPPPGPEGTQPSGEPSPAPEADGREDEGGGGARGGHGGDRGEGTAKAATGTEPDGEAGAEGEAGADPEPAAEARTEPGGEAGADTGPAPVPGPASDPDPAPAPAPVPDAPSPVAAFAELYDATSATLVRQAYLLTGRPGTAADAVLRGFQLAWEHWPKVAVDPDPRGWVRAAVHEYALSPWNRFRPACRGPLVPPAHAGDAALLGALLTLAPRHRRALLLHEGVGLGLPETAAETEASTPATASRLAHAREALTARLPELLAAPEELGRRLREFPGACEVPGGLALPDARRALARGESVARRRTGASLALTGLIALATGYCLLTAPDDFGDRGAPVTGYVGDAAVHPAAGPPGAPVPRLREALRNGVADGPQRLVPEPR